MKIVITLNKKWESDVDLILESLKDNYKSEIKSINVINKPVTTTNEQPITKKENCTNYDSFKGCFKEFTGGNCICKVDSIV